MHKYGLFLYFYDFYAILIAIIEFLKQNMSFDLPTIYLIIPGIIVVVLFFIFRDRFKIIGEKLSSTGGGTPILNSYCTDFTALAAQNKFKPVIGRVEELRRVIQILSRKEKNNPVLLGEAGVGKTAIVEGLAQRIVAKEVPSSIVGKRVLGLNVSALIAGTKYRGEFEKRLKRIVDEIKRSGRQIVLFIDEMHQLVEAKGSEGALDPTDILKPALARGDLQTIGACTTKEYEQHIKPDSSLERRFQPIQVDEPPLEMTIEILNGLRKIYENHHQVKLSDEAMKLAAELSAKYIKGRVLPDKAIDIIDESCAKVRLETVEIPKHIEECEKLGKKEEIDRCKKIWQDDKKGIRPQVTPKDVKEVVSMWTGVSLK